MQKRLQQKKNSWMLIASLAMIILKQQRKEQKELVYAKREAIDNLINGIIITIICSIGIAIAATVIYFVGKQQGKW